MNLKFDGESLPVADFFVDPANTSFSVINESPSVYMYNEIKKYKMGKHDEKETQQVRLKNSLTRCFICLTCNPLSLMTIQLLF